MLPRPPPSLSARLLARQSPCPRCQLLSHRSPTLPQHIRALSIKPLTRPCQPKTVRTFTSTPHPRYASPPPADLLIDRLTDLYGTARDEFEIAAEETEKKTVYAADDREAAKEAFEELKKAYEDALTQSEPEVGKEVQGRVGQRVRELGNALVALEEAALEDH